MKITLNDVIVDMAAGPFGSNLKVSSFVDFGFPIIDGANLKGVKVTDNISKYVTKEKAYSLARSIARRGDVVVTISGTLGQISYIPDDSLFEEYLCSQRQFRVTFDKEKVFVPYITYYFHSYEGQNKILAFANQVGVPALSQPLKNFRKIEIDLPPLEEQKKIAKVLLDLDAKIENNNKLSKALLEQNKLLVKRVLPHSSDDIVAGWKKVQLSEIANFVSGYSYKGNELVDNDDCVLVSIKNFDRNGGFKIDGFKGLIPSTRLKDSQKVELFDILVAHTDLTQNAEVIGNAEMLLSKMNYQTVVASMDLVKVESKIREISNFLLAAILSDSRFKKHCLGYVNGTTVLHLSKKALPDYALLLPNDLTCLENVDKLIEDNYRRISNCLNENIVLESLVASLLPKLMSKAIDSSKIVLEE